jgi:hypothetical protein
VQPALVCKVHAVRKELIQKLFAGAILHGGVAPIAAVARKALQQVICLFAAAAVSICAAKMRFNLRTLFS